MQNLVWAVLLPVLFLAYSLPLFLRVYATTKSVIDEEFHLRQGLYFCNKRFDVWDSKITTFPGLYLFSLVLNPLHLCSVLGLRLISLAAAAFNVVLLYKIRRRLLGGNSALAALDAFTIAALPPLYFFSHVYYTDALSLTTVLLFVLFWQKESHLIAAVFAAASVLMRQTNVVWVCMCVGVTALDVLTKRYASANRLQMWQVNLFNWRTWWYILTSGRMLIEAAWEIFCKCVFYMVIILPFVGFVLNNGSIVVGDKHAHEAKLHLPQLFYFSIFTLVFGVSNTLQQLRQAIMLMRREKLFTLFAIGICLLVVKWNTLVHPYLLADNRHYTFYIWQRLYERYPWFRYAISPLYVFAMVLIHCGIQHLRDGFKMMFWLSVVVALCFQSLLEIRYFLTPFVLFRLHTRPLAKSRVAQWLELAMYIGLNAYTFYIFFSKEIMWWNYREPQRIIW